MRMDTKVAKGAADLTAELTSQVHHKMDAPNVKPLTRNMVAELASQARHYMDALTRLFALRSVVAERDGERNRAKLSAQDRHEFVSQNGDRPAERGHQICERLPQQKPLNRKALQKRCAKILLKKQHFSG